MYVPYLTVWDATPINKEKYMNKPVKSINACRICGSKRLAPILSLGNLHVTDFVAESGGEAPMPKAPLDLVLCDKKSGGCGLLQLKHTFSPELMYRNYWYFSGVSQTMTNELHGIAKKFEALIPLKEDDFVIDIGTNDGTMLRGFKTKGLNLTGFEPAKNLANFNREGTTKIFDDFFNRKAWKKEFGSAKAKAIAAIAMFYDLDRPNKFVADVKKCLHENGVFIIQMNYLPSMLAQNAFDNISHEHLEYYSLLTLENLLSRHGLEVFDVERNNINGGSFRVYICHQGERAGIRIARGAARRVVKMRSYEKKLSLESVRPYKDFVDRVHAIREKTLHFIRNARNKGKKVYIYGASTRGNTLLQYFGIDHRLIVAAAEKNPLKWGRKTVGTDIPILSEAEARAGKPDYFLVLPWAFIEEFKKREHEDKSKKIYTNCLHDLFVEDELVEVVEDIAQWVKKRC